MSKNQTYKALFKIKEVITRDLPPLFTTTVEVDETYLGGQKRNKNKKQLKKEEALYSKSKKKALEQQNNLYLEYCVEMD